MKARRRHDWKGCHSWLGWLVIGLLLAPALYAIWLSFSPDSFLTPPTRRWSARWYLEFFQDRRWTRALGRSLAIASLAAFASVAVAAPAAWVIRYRSARARRFFAVVISTPAFVPPAALAVGLLPFVHLTRLWGTITGLTLAHATLGAPIAFLFVQAQSTERLRDWEAAARGLGAGPWLVFRRVTAPILAPTLVAAWISVFVLSLNESIVSLFLATPSNETLPAIVWPRLRYAPSPIVAVASTFTAVLGTAMLWILLRAFTAAETRKETP